MIVTGIVIFVLLFLDQLTKYLADINIAANKTVNVIPNVLSVTKIYNTGAGWGMFSNATWMLVVISALASIVLGYYCYKCDWKNKKLYSIGITLAFSGCVGNLFDRFISVVYPIGRSGVVDMIILEPLNNLWKLIFKSSFPIFNMADMYLVIGLIIFAIYLLFFTGKDAKNGTV